MSDVRVNAICSNFESLSAQKQLLDLMDGGGFMLRLFRNNFFPTQASLLSDFIDANFTGYSARSLTNQFFQPKKVIDGFYGSRSLPQNFTNSGIFDATVYGFFVSKGTQWYWGGAFYTPFVLVPTVTLTLILTWQGADLAVALA